MVDDRYKLYFATDEEIVLMNINNAWEKIASLKHDRLKGLTHGNPHPQYSRKFKGEKLPEPSDYFRGEFFTLIDEDGDEVYMCIRDAQGEFIWEKVL